MNLRSVRKDTPQFYSPCNEFYYIVVIFCLEKSDIFAFFILCRCCLYALRSSGRNVLRRGQLSFLFSADAAFMFCTAQAAGLASPLWDRWHTADLSQRVTLSFHSPRMLFLRSTPLRPRGPLLLPIVAKVSKSTLSSVEEGRSGGKFFRLDSVTVL